MTNKGRAQIMMGLVEQWKLSGKSQKQFSADHNIKLPTFVYWVKKHRQQQSPDIGFAKVEMTQNGTTPALARIEIELSDGSVVRIF